MLHFVKYALMTFRSPYQHTISINLLSIRIRFSVVRRRRRRRRRPWRKLFTFSFSSTENNGVISTKLGTKHFLGQGDSIKVCSNEGSRHFPKGDYYEIAKIH